MLEGYVVVGSRFILQIRKLSTKYYSSGHYKCNVSVIALKNRRKKGKKKEEMKERTGRKREILKSNYTMKSLLISA